MKTTIVLGNETVRTIQQMLDGKTVADLRKLASSKGLKNASKYKRLELVSKLFDTFYAEYAEKLEAEAKAKANKPKKAKHTTGSKKAPKGSNSKVNDDLAEALEYLDGSVRNDPDAKDTLLAYGRQVLIRVMATLKIKGWYRIYDKYTMVNKIVEQVAA